MGFGAVTSESLIGWPWPGMLGLHLTLLIVNLPQGVLSFLFLAYNSLFTCMLLGEEWSEYAYKCKPLRVTTLKGKQRSTYRLQLPYKYGIPLMVVSGLLHWLVSQSIFLARILYFNEAGNEDASNSISTVGYSCIALITVICLGSVVIYIGIQIGYRQYKPGMPLVGSSSAAISAACRRPKEDLDASTLPLLWGSVKTEHPTDRCYFTSFEVVKAAWPEQRAKSEASEVDTVEGALEYTHRRAAGARSTSPHLRRIPEESAYRIPLGQTLYYTRRLDPERFWLPATR